MKEKPKPKSLVLEAFKTVILSILFLLLLQICSSLGVKGADNSSGADASSSFVFTQGNALSVLSNPTNPEPRVVKKLPVILTAYSSTPEQTDDTPFVTASGSYVRDGIVANNLLPFGTKIRIPDVYGDKVFVVEDRMNRRKGDYHVDIWYPDYWQAKSFGAKNAVIEVLES